MLDTEKSLAILGWREWVALPALQIDMLKAKVDTGARSSALHAFVIEPYHQGKTLWVMFGIHPDQRDNERVIECHAQVKDRRIISDSGGHKQRRYVIDTPIVLGQAQWTTEITLTNRDSMRFRMLLGRTLLRGRYTINPEASYVQGRPVRQSLKP